MISKSRSSTFNTRFLIFSAMVLLATGLWSTYSRQYPSSPFGDDLTEHTPDRIYDGEVYRSGHLPIWNPYLFSGIDQPSVIQPGAFYPPNIIMYSLFSGVVAHNLMIVGHVLLTFYFLRQFLKLHNLTDWAATLGGLTLVLGSVTICFIEGVPNSNARVWVLAAFYFFERWIQSRRLVFCAWTGACFALALLAGWPQMVVLGGVYLLLYAVISLPGYLNKRWLIGGFVAAFLFSATLALVQILPTLELKRHSNLSELSYAFFGTCAVPPVLFVQMLIPFLFGMGKWPFSVPWLGPVNVYVMQIYVGILPLLLAPVSLLFWRRSRLVRFGAVTFIISLLLAGATYTPLGHLLYGIPVYNFFRDHYMHFFFTTLAIAILTSTALSALDLGMVSRDLRARFSKIIPVVFTAAFAGIMLARHSLFRSLMAGPHAWWPGYIQDAKLTLRPSNPATLAALAVMLLSFIPFWLKMRNPSNPRINWLIAFAFVLVMGPYSALVYGGPSPSQPAPTDRAMIERLQKLSSPAADRIYSIAWNNRFLHVHNNEEIPVADIMGYGSLFPYPYSNLLQIGGAGRSDIWADLILNHRILSLLNVRYILANPDQLQHLQQLMPISEVDPTPPAPLQPSQTELLSPEKWAAFGSKSSATPHSLSVAARPGDVERISQAGIPLEGDELYQLTFTYKTMHPGNHEPLGIAFGDPQEPRITSTSGTPLPTEPATFSLIHSVTAAEKTADLKLFTGSQYPIDISNISLRRIADLPLAGSYYKVVERSGDIVMLQNQDVLPRAFLVRRVQPVGSYMDARAALWNMTEPLDLRKTALVEASDIAPKGTLGSGEIRDIKYQAGTIKLQVACEHECYLVLTDRFDPGWKATIDGSPTRIYSTNGVVRGVFVPDGQHLVEFKYQPKWYNVAFWVSGFSGLALLLGTIVSWRRGHFSVPRSDAMYKESTPTASLGRQRRLPHFSTLQAYWAFQIALAIPLVLLAKLLPRIGGQFHEFQREQFHIVLWCAGASLLIAAILSFYGSQLGWRSQLSRVLRADIALSILPVVLVVLAGRVLHRHSVHAFGFVLAFFILGKCTVCTFFACSNGNFGSRRKALRWFLFATSLVFFATLAPWYTLSTTPEGDEPHYLLLTYSLLHEHDWVVGNNYDQRDYTEQFPPVMPGLNRWYPYASEEHDVLISIPTEPHVVTNSRGEKLLWHDIGVPVIVLPGYALAKRLGAVLTIGIVAATLPVAILEIAIALGATLPAAIITSLFFVFTPPLYCYAQSLFPEAFGAVGCLWTAVFFLNYRAKPRYRYVLGAGIGIALLPWFVMRFWPLAGILFLVFATYLIANRHASPVNLYKALAVLCSASVLSLIIFALFDHAHFGTYLPNGGLQLVQQQSPRLFWWRVDIALLGMLYDSAFGLLPTAPLYIAALAGIILVMLRRDFWGAAILFLPSAIYIGLLSRSGFWDGGWCPPARYILCGAILLAPAAALVVSKGTKRLLGFLAGWTLLVDLIYTADPFTRFPSVFQFQRPVPTALIEYLHDRLHIYGMYSLLSVFPVMQVPTAKDYVLAYLWLALSAIGVVWLIRVSRPLHRGN